MNKELQEYKERLRGIISGEEESILEVGADEEDLIVIEGDDAKGFAVGILIGIELAESILDE